MSITLSQFRAAASQTMTGGKLAVTTDGHVETKGTGLGRLVEWFRGRTTGGRNSKSLENLRTKESFLTAIREQYGDAMAKQAHNEIGKHKSLKGRTVEMLLKHAETHKDTFIKQHNASVVVSMKDEIRRVLGKDGVLKGIYEDVSGNPNSTVAAMFQKRYGMALPPFEPGMLPFFEKAVLKEMMRQASRNETNGLLPSLSLSQISHDQLKQYAFQEALTHIFATKGALSREQINEVLSNPETGPATLSALMDRAGMTMDSHPHLQKSILQNMATLFTEANNRGLEELANSMAMKGINDGMISPGTPGVGACYEREAEKYTGGEKVKRLCLAEKCYMEEGNLDDAVRMREETAAGMKKLVVDGTGRKRRDVKPPSIEQDRQRLTKLRSELTASASETSQKLRGFITDMYRECLAEFGVDEQSQSLMMLGSGSRDEMFPFSDLEFAVLTTSGNVDKKLQDAITLFTMRVTALGETPTGPDKTIPISEGLCLDPGGNSPKGGWDKEMVGPPESILGKLKGDYVTVEVFSAAKSLVGNESLAQRYNEGVRDHFQKASSMPEMSTGQFFAVNNLKDVVGGMSKGNPIAVPDPTNLQKIDAKKLTRFPFFVASALCKYHGVPPSVTNTGERLSALLKLGVLTGEEKTALENAFNGFGDLRLKAELFYQGQEHVIVKNEDSKLLSLPESEWNDMLKLLEPLNAIFQKVERFIADPKSEFQVVK